MSLPKTPAGRLELLLDLYAPVVEQEDDVFERDPEAGVIEIEEFLRLLEAE